ncbi:MAG: exodeoxyribonuclease V subunit alpha [Puniceicoccales bacterium]|jgi:exodeoxyribonuclease V alpha subunit|nr:exodeoxyribonuclease V subunit alpha [Puniceicoccales bacterium]
MPLQDAPSTLSTSHGGKILREALDSGLLRLVDYELLLAISRLYAIPETAHPHGALALALTSAVLGKGHVCLDLSRLDEIYPQSAVDDPFPPGFRGDIGTSAGRQRIFAGWDPVFSEKHTSPFVLDGMRLQLRRYHDYEVTTARRLVQGALDGWNTPECGTGIDSGQIDTLPLNDAQRIAVRMALERRLLIITGGPGTGKTHTLAQILRLLASAHKETSGRTPCPPRILLAAPTGKASARMYESIRAATAAAEMTVPAAAMPPARTIDSLLGYIPNSPYFRHNAQNPLPADILIVDEVSMLDLAKMAKLLDALPPAARLILLGDQHQLSAVAPGSVFTEICESPIFAPCLARLHESRRFPSGSLIERLATAVNQATTAAEARAALRIAAPVLHTPPPNTADARDNSALCNEIREGYRPLLSATTPAEAFAALDTFRILCATREGGGSVAEMNRLAAHSLAPLGLRPEAGVFHPFRVIMVTRNDPATGLYNGDVGVVLPDSTPPASTTPSAPVIWFPPMAQASDSSAEAPDPSGGDGAPAFRKIPCHLLPDHETAYAITIHKSQGSEFDKVLIHLPPRPVQTLCKELLYTALTRARKTVSIHARKSVFHHAVLHRPVRHSCLSQRFAEAKTACENRTGHPQPQGVPPD